MIDVSIPFKFSAEVQYTIEILLEEYLGLPIRVTTVDDHQPDFVLRANGMKSVILKNHFFSTITGTTYIDKKFIPATIVSWTDPNLQTMQLPVLFGEHGLYEEEQTITVKADLIASSFYMLSRWEDIVDENKDVHGRPIARQALAFKYNFLHRPIVNEYCDLIWRVLKMAGYRGGRKQHHFTRITTHDVDAPLLWPDWFTSFKHLGGDLLKRRDTELFLSHIQSCHATMIKKQKDPYDTFELLIQFAEKYQLQAYFNFIVSSASSFDLAMNVSDPRLDDLIKLIDKSGHCIGFHPGYRSSTDSARFKNELNLLQSKVNQSVSTGRQHYLRFKVPDTWRYWEENNMEWESSMGYSDLPGFKCGTCLPYSVFDVQNRKKLKLKEKPLIIMDATLIYYMKDWDWQDFYALKNECKKHGGEWVTIWHNDLVHHPKLKAFEELVYA